MAAAYGVKPQVRVRSTSVADKLPVASGLKRVGDHQRVNGAAQFHSANQEHNLNRGLCKRLRDDPP